MATTHVVTFKCDGPNCDFTEVKDEHSGWNAHGLNVQINGDTIRHIELCPACEQKLRDYITDFAEPA
jgi:hypothetical protein